MVAETGGIRVCFWVSENYTRCVHFKSHLPEWQMLSEFKSRWRRPGTEWRRNSRFRGPHLSWSSGWNSAWDSWILDSWNSKTSRINAPVEFRDVRGCLRIYRDSLRIYRVGFQDFGLEKQRTFCVINFWHVWILRIAYFSFLYQQIYFEFRSIISCQICLSENLCRSFSFFNLFYQNLSWMSFTK